MADIHTPVPKLKLNDGTSIPMVNPTPAPKNTPSKPSPTNTTTNTYS